METDIDYLISILETPVESDKIDYKSAVQFQESDDFALKLVKHILGFANSAGGHIIIGFHEDSSNKTLVIDGNLTDDIIRSYEVTRICQYVNSILGTQDRIDLKITKVEFKSKTFPVIYIAPFKRRPYFCKKELKFANGDLALEEGAIYIRVPGAQTVKVAGAGDWDKLISHCVEAEYETFVIRAKSLLGDLIPKQKKIRKEKSGLENLLKARKTFFKKVDG